MSDFDVARKTQMDLDQERQLDSDFEQAELAINGGQVGAVAQEEK